VEKRSPHTESKATEPVEQLLVEQTVISKPAEEQRTTNVAA